MLAPLAVQHGEHHAALELPHGRRRELVLAGLVGHARVGQDLLQQHVAGDAVHAARLVGDLLRRQRHRVDGLQGRPQGVQVPLLRAALGGGVGDVLGDRVREEVLHLLAHVLALEHAQALGVDDGALAGQDVVVLEDVLADLEVARLDLALRGHDAARDHLGLERHVVREAGAVHHRLGEAGVEQPHQVVLHRQVEPGLPRVALAAGTAAELVVDAAGLVPLGAQHVQAAGGLHLVVLGGDAGLGLLQRLGPGRLVLLRRLDGVEATLGELAHGEVLGVAAEHDVGTTAGHVRGDRDGALAARHRHDGGLALVLLGVEHVVRHAGLLQLGAEQLGLLDAGGTHQDRLAVGVPLHDVRHHGVELPVLVLVDEVGLVQTLRRVVRRDRDHAELVGALELGGLGLGRTGHARELAVQAEVVLEGDRGERLVLRLDLHTLLGLDGLVHALVVATAGEDTAGVLVDDHDLAVQHDVVLVPLEQLLGLDGVVQEADQRRVQRLVQVVDAEVVLDLRDARLQHADRALLLVHLVVHRRDQAEHDLRELRVPAVRVAGRGAGDDQRRTGLVDEDGVHLVDDGEVVPALHQVVRGPGHVVAQVVEAELVVRPVGDVGGVHLATLRRRLARQDDARGQAHEPEDAAHQLALVLGQVVVGGDDVHAVTRQGVEVRGGRGHQRLALTGAHLGDVAEVQRRTTHDLHVEVPLAERAAGGLADRRERLRHQLVQGGTVLETLPEPGRLLPELGVAELDEAGLQAIDLLSHVVQLLQDTSFADAKDLVEDGHAGSPRSSSSFRRRPS